MVNLNNGLQNHQREPIAIIGIGCNFPGARGRKAFWELMSAGVDALTEIPADRFDINAYHYPEPGTPGKIVTRRGGFLEQIDQFDPYFFGISPREATTMDPQQRLLLEVTWEALEDAGIGPKSLSGSSTGVFIGMCASDYGDLQLHFGDASTMDVYSVPGSARSILAGRLSYVLDLQGPAVALDTACSSSLVAVHLACQSLWVGETTLALAGGVNIILMPEAFVCFSLAGMLAPDGRCKFGDSHADGFVRSEGAGIVLLKPLTQAQADGDPIYAVIRGGAANNDGRSSGLMMPSLPAQEAVLRAAFEHAGVSPAQIQYVEAHGTGTAVGDPIELRALGAVLAEGRSKDSPCVVGSVKTNIGHLEGGAGIAGLIKVALALKHREIPPSLHFGEPNPYVPWQDLPLIIPQTLSPWPAGSGPALAGVNSFGIAGTNVHLVLEEAPEALPAPELQPSSDHIAQLLPLSAHTPEALEGLVQAYQSFLEDEKDLPSIHNMSYTASMRRDHLDHRLALVIHSREELAEHLDAFLRSEIRPGMSSGLRSVGHQPKLVFVFAGQGPKWWPLDQKLIQQEPVFLETLERCDKELRKYTGDWSLLDQLTADEENCRLLETDVVQPALLSVQIALVALWRSWGIEPDAIVGHSVGEVAAAHVAGALSLEDALRLISFRGPIMKRVEGKGRMGLVGLSMEQTQDALRNYEGRLSVAVSNSLTSTVVSGDTDALEEFMSVLEKKNVYVHPIPAVDLAAHSPHMEPMKKEIVRVMHGLQPQPTSVTMYSTVTGQPIDGLELGAQYWGRNLREPVLFSKTINRLLADAHEIFLEIHPHIVLARPIQEGLKIANRAGLVLPSLKRGEEGRVMMLGSLGALYTYGYPSDWKKLFPNGGQHVRLPSVPWQRERYWIQIPTAGDDGYRSRTRLQLDQNPLLGQHWKSAAHAGTHFWETDLGTESVPYLTDHRVQDLTVLPAAAYVEMIMSAAAETFGSGTHVLENLFFKKAMLLPEEGTRTVQLVLSPEMPGEIACQFFSRPTDSTDSEHAWLQHATGTIRLVHKEDKSDSSRKNTPEEIKSRCSDQIIGEEYYRILANRGLEYGPTFQGVAKIWRRDGEAIGQLCMPEKVSLAQNNQIHPALLDACFQVMAAAIPQETLTHTSEGDSYLPVGLKKFRLLGSPENGVWSHALMDLEINTKVDTIEGDVFLLNDKGEVLLEALGLSLQRLGSDVWSAVSEELDDWLYEVQWQPKPLQVELLQGKHPPLTTPGSWLIFADTGGLGKKLAQMLIQRGERCVLVYAGDTYQRTYKRQDREYYRINPDHPEDVKTLIQAAFGENTPSLRGIVHLWSLESTLLPEETTMESLDATQHLGCLSVLHLIQTLAKSGMSPTSRLWLVTRGSQAVESELNPVFVSQSPIWGLGKTISFEHPELSCTKIDLDPGHPSRETQMLFRELFSQDEEDQIALRSSSRFVPRLVRFAREDVVEKSIVIHGEQPYHLEVSPPGILENLRLRATQRRKPGAGQVEILVYAAGLNFLDVLSAMGMRPDQTDGPVLLGMECAGKVVAVGEGVEKLNIGDEVVAIAPSSFSRYVITAAPFVVPKPEQLSFQEATTIPVAFLTAYYALDYLGRMKKGDRVLIHAAAGGVGLAAVRLAQRTGAEIFATAGKPEKREFLRSLGIEHVMDSRSLEFADQVMEFTGGRGVDIVLNSLAGEFIPKSLSTLCANGRFLEIGKRDIYQSSQLDMGHFRNNISFFAVDLVPMFLEQAQFCGTMLREILEFFEDGSLDSLPYREFPISKAEDAFRFMAQAMHIGKIVVALEEDQVQVAPSLEDMADFRSDGTYLITGGLGGLGLSVASWLVEQGVQHLALMGRSDPSAAANEFLNSIKNIGTRVSIIKADVSRQDQVAEAISKIRQTMPPLRGIIHAAGVLDDGFLLQLDVPRFETVMAPKVSGAWNLHSLTMDDPLDIFVLFSSVASVLGSPGQGNYAAANAFLDGLAHYRSYLGLPAQSINWGAWAEVGLASRPDRIEHVRRQGIIPFSPDQGVRVFERLLKTEAVQVTGIAVDWSKLPGSKTIPLLSVVAKEIASGPVTSQVKKRKADISNEKLQAMEPNERQNFVEALLKEQIAKVLRASPEKIDVHQPLDSLGIDSLMGYELINRLESDLEVSIPMTILLQGPSLSQLAQLLLEQLIQETSIPTAEQEGVGDTDEHLIAQVEQLSDQEVDALLQEYLQAETNDRDKGE